jgi:hypothetical protein
MSSDKFYDIGIWLQLSLAIVCVVRGDFGALLIAVTLVLGVTMTQESIRNCGIPKGDAKNGQAKNKQDE